MYLHKLQGSTAVALYGLGNIRDERLSRMFQVCEIFSLSSSSSMDFIVLSYGCDISFVCPSDTTCCAVDAA